MKKNMNKKDDYVLMLAALLLLILSAGVIFWFSGDRQDKNISPSAPKIIGKAVLTIDFGDDRKRNFEGEIINGETLFDALNQASKAGNFSYQLDEKNNLAAIDSFTRNKNKSWHWYLNGEKIDMRLNEVIIKDDDDILIKYD